MNSLESVISTLSSYKSSVLTTSDLIETTITLPPDGGWGWIIVVSAFIVNFVADGSIYTFGIFLDEIGKSFNVEPTTVALASSLMTGFYYLSGPIACAVVNRCGFQITGILGGIISSVAFFSSSFQESITLFLVLLGFLGGLGFCLIYVPSIVVIGFYFDRWRALATSIAATGSAIGVIGFPIILENLLGEFHWRKQFRIIAGGCLMCSVFALTYRPLKPMKVTVKNEKKAVQFLNNPEADGKESIFFVDSKKPGFFRRIFSQFHNTTYPTASRIHKDSTVVINLAPITSSTSTFLSTNPLEGISSVSLRIVPSKVDGSIASSKGDEAKSLKLDKLSTVFEQEPVKPNKCKKCCKRFFHWERQNKPMYRDDIFYTGPSLTATFKPTVSSFIISQHSSIVNNADIEKIKSVVEYQLSVTRVAIKEKDGEKVHCKCCPESVIRTIVTMLNFTLLKSPSFCLLSLSGFFSLLGLFVPYIYLIEKAHECGISKEKAFKFYLVLGIANAIGRLATGLMSTIPQMKPLPITYVSLLICGLITLASYFICSISGHFGFISIFGLTTACLATLRAPILVELFGLEALTNAFGLILLIQGIAGFTGLPLAGAVVSLANKSYRSAFIFSGSCITLSAILLFPVKHISEWEKIKKQGNV